MANIEVKGLDISPNPCPIGDAVNLKIEYDSDAAISGAHWEIKYMVDMTGKRMVVEIGKSQAKDVIAGRNVLEFSAPAIDVSGVKKSVLNNVGLLLACLVGPSGDEVIQVSMVTQVSKNGDQLFRTVLSPLD